MQLLYKKQGTRINRALSTTLSLNIEMKIFVKTANH
jgi:hypothetical protein